MATGEREINELREKITNKRESDAYGYSSTETYLQNLQEGIEDD